MSASPTRSYESPDKESDNGDEELRTERDLQNLTVDALYY
jgi:hypothetical protein